MDRIGARAVAELLGRPVRTGRPLHVALADAVRLCTSDGRLPVGVRLPPERELALALGVSRATVTAAYGRLRSAGWATARQGSGTWTALPDGRAGGGAWVPAPVDASTIDLAHAAPSAPPEVPAAFAAALAQLPRLLPGHGYAPAGLPELRARIAERYTARGLPTRPEEVLVTSGALHAVHVALQTLVRRGRRVLVDAPTYPNSLDAARALGLRPTPVALEAEDADGWLQRIARTAGEAQAAAAYLMPDFHNPTGLLLDDRQREQLGAALQRAGTVPVVDETLVDLGLDAVPGPPLGAFAPCVSVGSMSKSFWGGLRVGWLRADTATVRALSSVLQTASMSGPAVEQLAACALLDGADDVLVLRREQLRERRAVLQAELAAHLPQWQTHPPAGGLVLWCRLPGLSSSQLVQAAERRGLLLAAGPRFGTGHAFDDRLRLPFTAPPEVLRRAVRLLADAAQECEHGAPAASRAPVA